MLNRVLFGFVKTRLYKETCAFRKLTYKLKRRPVFCQESKEGYFYEDFRRPNMLNLLFKDVKQIDVNSKSQKACRKIENEVKQKAQTFPTSETCCKSTQCKY